jgi:predicted DNA-binding transcriptional regulator AlpA
MTVIRPISSANPKGAGGELPELLTAEEVAVWLKISVKAVYAKSERGTLPGATHLGRRLYFVRSELLSLVEQGRVPTLGDAHVGA